MKERSYHADKRQNNKQGLIAFFLEKGEGTWEGSIGQDD